MNTPMKSAPIKCVPIKCAPIKCAMIMAAGLGTRLRPHTNTQCKAMVKVDGQALIDHMLDRLEAAGIETAIVNIHAFGDALETHLLARQKSHPDLQIIISDERDEILETGGGLVKALPLINQYAGQEGNGKTAPILICNIDAIWLENNPALPFLMAAWDGDIMDELLLQTPTDKTIGFAGFGDFKPINPDHVEDGCFVMTRPEFTNTDKTQRATAPFVYAGVQVFKPDLAKSWPLEKFSRSKIWDQTLKSDRLFGHVMDGVWMHVGDPQALSVTQAMLEERRTKGQLLR